jgi:hypothetical protein
MLWSDSPTVTKPCVFLHDSALVTFLVSLECSLRLSWTQRRIVSYKLLRSMVLGVVRFCNERINKKRSDVLHLMNAILSQLQCKLVSLSSTPKSLLQVFERPQDIELRYMQNKTLRFEFEVLTAVPMSWVPSSGMWHHVLDHRTFI